MSDAAFEDLCGVAGPVSRETFERLRAFEGRFRKWAGAINLAAPSTLADLWTRHILDSAQLVRLKPNAVHWLDLGSGGGFPGLVVAILIRDRAGAHVDLIESNRKKAAFLIGAAAALEAPAKVHTGRIESVAPRIVGTPEIVTARALAPLSSLLSLASTWLAGGSTGLFHKGRDYRSEIEESINRWRFDLVEHPSSVDPEGVVLEVSNLSPIEA